MVGARNCYDPSRSYNRMLRGHMNIIKPLHLRGAEVDTLIGIGKTTRFSWQDPKSPYYDPTWPLPIRLGTRKTVYIADEVEAWLKARPRTRDIEGAKEVV